MDTGTSTEEEMVDDGKKNRDGATKREKNKGRGINGYVPKEK